MITFAEYLPIETTISEISVLVEYFTLRILIIYSFLSLSLDTNGTFPLNETTLIIVPLLKVL